MTNGVEQELREATQKILDSKSRKKLVVAGPGTGKTYLFRKLLEGCPGGPDERLVLTFINNLKKDLDRSLGELAQVFTLHSYCQHLLYRHEQLRGGLSSEFKCYPGLVSLIKEDWQWLQGSDPPKFIKEMRDLECVGEHEAFYNRRANYYDAVDFDDSVYRTYRQIREQPDVLPQYELVLIDEFQDFNSMEAAIINILSDRSPIIIAGDDDQALYSQFRSASWDHIRAHHQENDYEVFELPFCMRCPEVVVGAVNDVILKARADGKLDGRIDKPYRFYEPLKGVVSRLHPNIDLVCTTVQRGNANYFGKYLEKIIQEIPEADIAEASESFEPVALIIGPKPYLPQVKHYLIEAGLLIPEDNQVESEHEKALKILSKNPDSNLGWRIVLSCGDKSVAAEYVQEANRLDVPLAQVITEDERTAVLHEAAEFEANQEAEVEIPIDEEDIPRVKLTSYEGSKGLSAQHVFLVGLHAGDLPRNPDEIHDIEICRFVVGLTRTKKKCSVLLTQNFAGNFKIPSPFISWINAARFMRIKVNAAYWNN